MQLLHSQIHKQDLHHLRAVHVLRTDQYVCIFVGMLLQVTSGVPAGDIARLGNIQQIGRRRERALKGRRLCAPQHRIVLVEGKAGYIRVLRYYFPDTPRASVC